MRIADLLSLASLGIVAASGSTMRRVGGTSRPFTGCVTAPLSNKGRKPKVYVPVHGRTRRQSGVIARCCIARRPQDVQSLQV